MKHRLFDFAVRHRLETGQPLVRLPYMRDLCRAVELCVAGMLPGGKRNLAIAIPPRHYKTTFVSQAFPAWSLAELDAGCEFILTSSTAELAVNNAVQVRKIIDSEWYRSEYPEVRVSKADRDTSHYFRTDAGGAVYATGVGGTVTGFGAGKTRPLFGGAVVIDDPIKADDARSPVKRQHCIDYYLNTLKSRRNSKATPVVLVMQRLHVDDLAGFVERNEPESWHMHSFPARDEATGEVLNPVMLDAEYLDRLEEVAPSVYHAQYQQRPHVESTYAIDVSRISVLDWPGDASGRVFATVDSAMSPKELSDKTVIGVYAARKGSLTMLEARHGHWDFPMLLDQARLAYRDMMQRYGRAEMYVEDKVSGTSLVQTLRDEMRIHPWRPQDVGGFPQSKQGRVQASLPVLYSGVFKLGSEVPHDVVAEMANFRNDMGHAHDDFVDSVTMACSLWLWWGGKVLPDSR